MLSLFTENNSDNLTLKEYLEKWKEDLGFLQELTAALLTVAADWLDGAEHEEEVEGKRLVVFPLFYGTSFSLNGTGHDFRPDRHMADARWVASQVVRPTDAGTYVYVDTAHAETRTMAAPKNRDATAAETELAKSGNFMEKGNRKFTRITLGAATKLGLAYTAKLDQPMIIAENGPQVSVRRDIFEASVAGIKTAHLRQDPAAVQDLSTSVVTLASEPHLLDAIYTESAKHFNGKEENVTIPAAVANALGIVSQTALPANSVTTNSITNNSTVFVLRTDFLTYANNAVLASGSSAVADGEHAASPRAAIISEAQKIAGQHKDSKADIIPVPSNIADQLGLVTRYASADAKPGQPLNLGGGVPGRQVAYELTAH